MFPVGQAAVEYYRSGANKTQRFGQFYCNQYLGGTPWPELFYEADNAKAILMLMIAERDREESE